MLSSLPYAIIEPSLSSLASYLPILAKLCLTELLAEEAVFGYNQGWTLQPGLAFDPAESSKRFLPRRVVSDIHRDLSLRGKFESLRVEVVFTN